MKNSYIHNLAILSLVLLLAACNKIEPDFFDKDYNGAYFNYNNSVVQFFSWMVLSSSRS